MCKETSITGEVVKQSKEVLGKAYDDLIHPTAKPVGNMVSFIPRTINVLLGKWEKWIINGEESIRLTSEAVREKMAEIPEENLTEPEPYVAVPAIQQLAYCYDSEELREMYANLLVASMNKETKYQVHPSFVDIIKQLTPDEAKLLKHISKRIGQGNFPVINVVLNTSKTSHITIVKHFSDIGYGVCDVPENIAAYLENLSRLGIIEIPSGSYIVNDAIYHPLENHEVIKAIMEKPLQGDRTYKIERELFYITMFGHNFIATCI